MTLHGALIREPNIALFLDVDGTLLEIAATPSKVKVPAALRNTLRLVAAREAGAVALISGRPIEEVDRLFAPSCFPTIAQHGLERRNAKGKHVSHSVDTGLLQQARRVLCALEARHRGLLLEDKGASLAMHYRQARGCEPLVREVMNDLANQMPEGFRVQSGRCVLELVPTGCSIRNAIEALMSEPPFEGRVPVFVSDDTLYEDGFTAVNELGGYSIRVGKPAPSAARYSFASVPAVIAWLRGRNLKP